MKIVGGEKIMEWGRECRKGIEVKTGYSLCTTKIKDPVGMLERRNWKS